MADEAVIKSDEQAEIKLRILVALYDGGSATVDATSKSMLRPGALYTGPADVQRALDDLRGEWIKSGASIVDQEGGDDDDAGVEVSGVEMEPEARARLDEPAGTNGSTWLTRARKIIADGDKGISVESEATILWDELSYYPPGSSPEIVRP